MLKVSHPTPFPNCAPAKHPSPIDITKNKPANHLAMWYAVMLG